jgi:hypothetical protein
VILDQLSIPIVLAPLAGGTPTPQLAAAGDAGTDLRTARRLSRSQCQLRCAAGIYPASSSAPTKVASTSTELAFDPQKDRRRRA